MTHNASRLTQFIERECEFEAICKNIVTDIVLEMFDISNENYRREETKNLYENESKKY